MFRTRPARWGAVLWLGLNGAVPAAGLGMAGGARAPWATPPALFASYLAAVLFFLLFVWPLLIPPAVRAAGAEAGGAPRAGRTLAAHLLLFAALGLPFALLCAILSGTGAGTALRGVAVLAAATACASAAFGAGGWASPRFQVLYQAAAWALCAAAPFAWYLSKEWTGADWAWLAALSPFRGVVDPGAPTGWGPLWSVQASGFGLVAAVAAAAPFLPGRRRGAAPPGDRAD